MIRAFAPAATGLMLLAACADDTPEPVAATSVGESQALDDAAAMLDERPEPAAPR